jgi:nicotinate-nucleotide adenylyltransferase
MTADIGHARIGVLGGSFDPPHLAHLMVAGELHSALGLDEVVFVPAGDPWQKSSSASAEQRYDMVRLATDEDVRFRVSRIDIDREGPTYMVDTLADLHAENPHAELFCLIGSDILAGIHTWYEAERLAELATFVCAVRPGFTPNQPALTGLAVDFVEVPLMEISSSDIRQRVSEGESIRYLVPDAVADFIATHELYGRTS